MKEKTIQDPSLLRFDQFEQFEQRNQTQMENLTEKLRIRSLATSIVKYKFRQSRQISATAKEINDKKVCETVAERRNQRFNSLGDDSPYKKLGNLSCSRVVLPPERGANHGRTGTIFYWGSS